MFNSLHEMSGSCTKASKVATRLSLFSRKTVITCRNDNDMAEKSQNDEEDEELEIEMIILTDH